MECDYKEVLRHLISEKETEDIDREWELALYHLEKSLSLGKDLNLLTKGLKKGIPVPNIIGYTLVCGLEIGINQYVLHPGPETVLLIEKAIEYVNFTKSTMVLDLCTGSGAVAISIAKNCDVHVVATDISEKALETAKLNAVNNDVQIEFLQGDLFAPMKGRKFDIIITNPPYVKTNDIVKLPKFIREFAPMNAVDGGIDGLFFHKSILSQAKKYLSDKKVLFIECEDGQDEDIMTLCHQYNWQIEDKYRNRYEKIRGFKLVLL